MNSTITAKEQQAIARLVKNMQLCMGVGNEESACSIAAINLALSNRLTDEIPECMSNVIGEWIIRSQDYMPDVVRNSLEWKNLLPLAAGTGKELEAERLDILLDATLTHVLGRFQPLANELGVGDSWKRMLLVRTSEAAEETRTAILNVIGQSLKSGSAPWSELDSLSSLTRHIKPILDARKKWFTAEGASETYVYYVWAFHDILIMSNKPSLQYTNDWEKSYFCGTLERLINASKVDTLGDKHE